MEPITITVRAGTEAEHQAQLVTQITAWCNANPTDATLPPVHLRVIGVATYLIHPLYLYDTYLSMSQGNGPFMLRTFAPQQVYQAAVNASSNA